MKIFAAIALGIISTAATAQAPDGWHILRGEWKTENGVTSSRADDAIAWIESDAVYSDFVLELEFQTPEVANGGVQVRSHWLPNPEAPDTSQYYGYQINIETRKPDGTGAILDKNGRGHLVVASPEAQKAVKLTDWNHMRIEARGGVMAVWINDVKANHIHDEAFLSGRIGLQVEPRESSPGVVRYRNIKIEDLGRLGKWRSLFNGRSTKGWTVFGSERFEVENGVINGRSGPKKSEGYLLTNESWTDFRVRGKFKMLGEGNFGLFYRSNIVLREKDGYPLISGVQGEVDPAHPGPSGWHYESYRRGWIHEPPQKESMRAYAAKPGEWGEIEIRCIGNRTTSWINGIRIVDFYDDNPQVFEGGFALQLHAGGVEGIQWKDLYVLD